ncbi:DUF4225 domain-containing protein [Pseudomonas abieticivorans]|uniref:DUF4225 domain-containing protein n=1 Tax=Pseudomonas abieticivorans TaxID=2931382 RepID=UPI0020BE39A7|nr:DUF4225 domain-containing protein [Pseudomonas sp. PIA16]
MQFATGAGICYASLGTLCALMGVPIMAHGANNVYENGRNLWTGKSDAQGPVRHAYHGAAGLMNRGQLEGNLAYGAIDIGMSMYGVTRLVLKPDARRLFRYIRTDYIQSYKQAKIGTLTIDSIATGITLRSMRSAFEKTNE